ncbi:hypothetical protein EXN61_21595 [Agrobacterium tumefaciens]|uniref:Lytic transglycosylase domain-containing protein n=1 Tax=Agrobacterium tumefaciens TaxID=358 RepID=A0A546XRU9_AGRTU|nr:hypothetical protein [Agrobacterium tumefaciens]TRB03463.1 hypothetical protein EXN61_21595 [Agrobacterium tumefaciens]
MRKTIAVAAAAAALSTFASFGLSRAAPQPVRRGDLDISSPYIPPATPKPTKAEKVAASIRMVKAEAKRARKAAYLMARVANGSIATP